MYLGDSEKEKWENGSEAVLEEADKFLEKHNSMKVTQEETLLYVCKKWNFLLNPPPSKKKTSEQS